MISQSDEAAATILSPATTTTNNNNNNHNHHHNHIHDSSDSTILAKGAKAALNNVSRKRKRFDETIIDGFSIIAFKSWEDLQDDLNERSSTTTNTTANNDTCETTNSCTADKKSKSKQKNSCTLLPTTAASTTTNSSSLGVSNSSDQSSLSTTTINSGKKSKEKVKKTKDHPLQTPKESKDKQRNKSSSEKNTLKKALEAKELAEKRLSILEEKLKQEQKHQHYANQPPETNRVAEQQQQPNLPIRNQITKEDILHNPRGNGFLRHDLLKEPTSNSMNQVPKAAQYSAYLINTQVQRSNATAINQQNHQSLQILSNTPTPPREIGQPSQNQVHQSKHPSHLISHQFQSHRMSPPVQMNSQQHSLSKQQNHHPPPPLSHLHHSTPPTSQSNSIHQAHLNAYSRQPPIPIPSPHPHLLQHQTQIQQPPLHPYATPVPSSTMSALGLASLPTPYSCPPSIYITDTISRQTSIINPQQMAPSFETPNPQLGASRFGHTTAPLHSLTPYLPPVPTHHSMHYPTLATQRSFHEYTRNFTGHLDYSRMNSFSQLTPSYTANPYSFDRWALDHQRAVSRYNSLHQSTTTIPTDRSYTNHTNSMPPIFHPPFLPQ